MSHEVQGNANAGALSSGARQVYFTGKQDDESTAVSGTATTQLQVGCVVCFTQGGGIKARGIDVTKPQTAILSLFAGIVTGWVGNAGQLAVAGDGSGTTAGNLIPGWITITAASAAIQALTIANMTKPQTAPFPLGPANASWALKAVTSSIGSGAANFLYLTSTCAIALETVDTSGASEPGTLKYVRLGGVVGGLET